MSLFDVIRYPVSNPPTKEELVALPEPIWRAWRTHALKNPTYSFEHRCQILHKIILEYNDDLPCD